MEFFKSHKEKEIISHCAAYKFRLHWHKHRFDKCIVTEPED